MEVVDAFFKDRANRLDPTNACLRLAQTLDKQQTKLKNNYERCKKKSEKEKNAENETATEAAQKDLKDHEALTEKYEAFCTTLRFPPIEKQHADVLAELPFAREKTRLFSIHTKFGLSATALQKATGDAIKDDYNAAKTARERVKSFEMNPAPAIKKALDLELANNPEFATYIDSNFGPKWAYDNATDLVETKTIDVAAPGKAAKKATVAVVSEASTMAVYDPFVKIQRVYYHLFVGWISEKAVNFRPKKRGDLSFMFSFQMLTGHDELPEQNSEEALVLAHKLQSAIYVVSKTPCEPLLEKNDGLPVPAATKAMRSAAKDNKLFTRDAANAVPEYQLMFSLAFPESSKLRHDFAKPLDGRFLHKLTPKVAKFVAEAVTKLAGEEAIVPILKTYLAAIDEGGKYKGKSIEFASVANENAMTWAIPTTEPDLTSQTIPVAWAAQPFANPYAYRIRPDGTKQLRLLSLRNLSSSTYFDDCLLSLHALDTTSKTTDSLKANYDEYVKRTLEGVAFESTGVSRSASYLKSQTRAITVSGEPVEKKRKNPSDKSRVVTLTAEVEDLRSQLRVREEEASEALLNEVSKRQKTEPSVTVEQLLQIMRKVYPAAVEAVLGA
jgi:hypothetical protein